MLRVCLIEYNMRNKKLFRLQTYIKEVCVQEFWECLAFIFLSNPRTTILHAKLGSRLQDITKLVFVVV